MEPEIFICFVINSELNLTQTQIFTLKLTPNLNPIFNPLKSNEKARMNIPRFRFIVCNLKILQHSLLNCAFMRLDFSFLCSFLNPNSQFFFHSEDMILQEDLIQMMPMINEANAISEELDRKMVYEIVLIGPQGRGLTEGKTEV